jgi:hypothetical protein
VVCSRYRLGSQQMLADLPCVADRTLELGDQDLRLYQQILISPALYSPRHVAPAAMLSPVACDVKVICPPIMSKDPQLCCVA